MKIQNKKQYIKALTRLEQIFNSKDKKESSEANKLSKEILKWENEIYSTK